MGNSAAQNESHNKSLMQKYLRNLFSTTFSKYSKVSPKLKSNVRPCCIIIITSCNYSAFTTVFPHLIILHQRILARVHNT